MKHRLYLLSLCILAGMLSQVFAAPGVVAAWSFDSAAGNTYYDVSGHGYNASSAGLSQSAGIKGNALSCPGSGYELIVANSNANFNLTRFSIESWFYTNVPMSQMSSESKIFDFQKINSGIRNGYGIHVTQAGEVVFALSNTSGSTWITATTSSLIQSQTWYHIVCTYDSSALKVYVNGNLKATTPYVGTYVVPNANARIGCRTLNDGTVLSFVNGKLDEMALYNYALPADSVAAHYKKLIPELIPCSPNPTTNTKPTFRWKKNTAIKTFRIQIATDSSFLEPLYSIPLLDTFFIPTVDISLGTVYWRVGNDASTSLWSGISSLTIQDAKAPVIIPYTPDPTYNRKPILSWHRVSGASQYTVQVTTAASFASPLITMAVSDSFYVVSTDLPYGAVYWHVKSNLSSQYSAIDTFTVINDSVPSLIPMYPDTQSIQKPTFKWHRSTGAVSYRLQIDTNGSFINPYISIPVADTVYTPTISLPYGKIVWRVSSSVNVTRYSTTDTFWIKKGSSINEPQVRYDVRNDRVTATINGRNINIKYLVDNSSNVIFRLVSLNGKCIASLNAGQQQPGSYQVTWNVGDNRYGAIPRGAYIVSGTMCGKNFACKIILSE